jgi:DNA-binding XRE family transcriptional regulator
LLDWVHAPSNTDFPVSVNTEKPDFSQASTQRKSWRMKKRSKDNEHVEIGARLQRIREAFGFSQQEMADLAAVALTTWNGWETGHGRLSLDGGRAIRRKLGVSLDYLFEGDLATLSAKMASDLSPK